MIGPEFVVPQKPLSERCLYLNVWTAASGLGRMLHILNTFPTFDAAVVLSTEDHLTGGAAKGIPLKTVTEVLSL